METEPTIRMSRLESWLRKREPLFTNRWHYIGESAYNVWGVPRLFACGSAPEIYPLRGEPLDGFVERSTDDEIEQFVAAMRSDDRNRQEAAVEDAFHRILNP
jgi:hypothetical protein